MKEQDFYNVAVATIKANKDGVIAIIRKNGIAINSGANEQTINNAVLSLLKTSPAFKKDFGDLIIATNNSYVNATGNFDLTSKKLETPKVDLTKSIDFGTPKEKDSDSKNKSGYWGEVFNPDFTRNALDNIMNIVSVKLGAGNTTPYSGFQNASNNIGDDPKNSTTQGGLSVGSILGISLGVIAIVAGVIYFVKKK